MSKKQDIIASHYPEVNTGGLTSVDGTVEFYSRINAPLGPSMDILDFGAGRGAWFDDDPCDCRRQPRTLHGKVRSVVACAIDAVVLDSAIGIARRRYQPISAAVSLPMTV